MKSGTIVAFVVLFVATAACADEVSDHLERALALYKAGKPVEAQVEIEKALELIRPLAKAKIPPPEVKDGTYMHYELNFRVTAPIGDWKITTMKSKTPGPGGTTPLCQISWMKENLAGDDVVIFYVRDLKVFLGPRYDTLKGQEIAFLKTAGQQMASSIRQLTDVQVKTQEEVPVSGLVGVRTDYVAKKGEKSMKCYTIHVLREHLMFTAMFVGNAANEKDVTPAFKQILESIDLSPVPPPEK